MVLATVAAIVRAGMGGAGNGRGAGGRYRNRTRSSGTESGPGSGRVIAERPGRMRRKQEQEREQGQAEQRARPTGQRGQAAGELEEGKGVRDSWVCDVSCVGVSECMGYEGKDVCVLVSNDLWGCPCMRLIGLLVVWLSRWGPPETLRTFRLVSVSPRKTRHISPGFAHGASAPSPRRGAETGGRVARVREGGFGGRWGEGRGGARDRSARREAPCVW